MIKTKVFFFALLMVVPVVANLYYTSRHDHESVRAEADARLSQAETAVREVLRKARKAAEEEAVAAAQVEAVKEALAEAAKKSAAVTPEGFARALAALGHTPPETAAEAGEEAPEAAHGEGEAAEKAPAGGAGEDGGSPEGAAPKEGAAGSGEMPAHTVVILANAAGVSRFELGGEVTQSESLPDLPVLRRALDGTPGAELVRREDGAVMWMAAAPVRAELRKEVQVVGAVALGVPVGEDLAGALEAATGLPAVVLVGSRVLAATVPPAKRPGLAEVATAAEPRRIFPYGQAEGLKVLPHLEALTGVEVPKFYGVRIPLPGLDDGSVVFLVDVEEAARALDRYQLYHLAAAAAILLFGLLWSFVVSAGGYGPPRRMVRQLQRAVSGDLKTRLDPGRYPGPFRKLAETINTILDHAERRSPGLADEVLSPKGTDISAVLAETQPELPAAAPPEESGEDEDPFARFGGGAPAAEAPAPPAPEAAAPAAPASEAAASAGGFDPFAE
ncbi:MAG: hypothetical protein D6729_07850, partial [Deltaproteobacteria bacterium]